MFSVAFGRLCVETLLNQTSHHCMKQSPSGGCVLKLQKEYGYGKEGPVAFGRLCVETFPHTGVLIPIGTVAFGRLCVETLNLG